MSEPFEIRPSRRRTRTMAAYREGGRVVVVVPARLSRHRAEQLAPGLVAQLLERERGRQAPRGDAELTERARELYRAYLEPQVPGPVPDLGARWVTNQNARWGSCTQATGEIRISHHVKDLPGWVRDYVLVHELTHLVEHNHTARFHALLSAYPETEKAKGFLEGVLFARRQGPPDGADGGTEG